MTTSWRSFFAIFYTLRCCIATLLYSNIHYTLLLLEILEAPTLPDYLLYTGQVWRSHHRRYEHHDMRCWCRWTIRSNSNLPENISLKKIYNYNKISELLIPSTSCVEICRLTLNITTAQLRPPRPRYSCNRCSIFILHIHILHPSAHSSLHHPIPPGSIPKIYRIKILSARNCVLRFMRFGCHKLNQVRCDGRWAESTNKFFNTPTNSSTLNYIL